VSTTSPLSLQFLTSRSQTRANGYFLFRDPNRRNAARAHEQPTERTRVFVSDALCDPIKVGICCLKQALGALDPCILEKRERCLTKHLFMARMSSERTAGTKIKSGRPSFSAEVSADCVHEDFAEGP